MRSPLPLLLALGTLVLWRPTTPAALAESTVATQAALAYQGTHLPKPPGATSAMALDLNEAGEVVGQAYDGVTVRAVLWKEDQAIDISNDGPPGVLLARANGLNDKGQVVGRTEDGRSFLWEEGSAVILPGLEAIDINEAGTVLVRTQGGSGLVKKGQFIPGTTGLLVLPAALNEKDEYCGTLVTAQGSSSRAFVFRGGQTQILPVPAGTQQSSAVDINEAGTVAGVADVSANNVTLGRGLLWKGGSFVQAAQFTGASAQLSALNDGEFFAGMVSGGSNAGSVFFGRVGAVEVIGTLGFSVPGSGVVPQAMNSRGDLAGIFGSQGEAFVARAATGVKGKVEYERVPVTSTGLNFGGITQEPVAGVKVELFRQGATEPLASGETNDEGEYELPAPADRSGSFFLRVQATSAEGTVRNSGRRQAVHELRSASFRMPSSGALTRDLLAEDRRRTNGSFHLLALLRRANEFLQQADPTFSPQPINISWDPSQFLTLHFGPDLLVVRGNRRVNADEFDDGLVLKAYGELLFSVFRPDAAGASGVSILDDVEEPLTPPFAFKEGFGMFFAASVLEERVLRNSVPGGAFPLDLEADPFSGTAAFSGPFSSHAVAAFLWDLADAENEEGDTVSLGFAEVWSILMNGVPEQPQEMLDVVDFFHGLTDADPNLDTPARALLSRQLIEVDSDAYPFELASGQEASDLVDFLDRPDLFPLGGLHEDQHLYLVRLTQPGLKVTFEVLGAPAGTPRKKVGARVELLQLNGDLLLAGEPPNGTGVVELVNLTLTPKVYLLSVRPFRNGKDARGTYRLSAVFQ